MRPGGVTQADIHGHDGDMWPEKEKFPLFRLLRTSAKAWQIYGLQKVNENGTAVYYRWPKDGIIFFTDEKAAETKVRELIEETAS